MSPAFVLSSALRSGKTTHTQKSAQAGGESLWAGSLTDVGINDDFIRKVKAQVTEGTSCLFLMTAGATEDKVVEAMKQYKFEIVSTNLAQEHEDALRKAFAESA